MLKTGMTENEARAHIRAASYDVAHAKKRCGEYEERRGAVTMQFMTLASDQRGIRTLTVRTLQKDDMAST